MPPRQGGAGYDVALSDYKVACRPLTEWSMGLMH